MWLSIGITYITFSVIQINNVQRAFSSPVRAISGHFRHFAIEYRLRKPDSLKPILSESKCVNALVNDHYRQFGLV